MLTDLLIIIVLAVFATFYAYILNVSSQPVAPIDTDKHRFLWRMRQLYCPDMFIEAAARLAVELLICGILLDVGSLFVNDKATVILAIPVIRLLEISVIRSVIVAKAKKYHKENPEAK